MSINSDARNAESPSSATLDWKDLTTLDWADLVEQDGSDTTSKFPIPDWVTGCHKQVEPVSRSNGRKKNVLSMQKCQFNWRCTNPKCFRKHTWGYWSNKKNRDYFLRKRSEYRDRRSNKHKSLDLMKLLVIVLTVILIIVLLKDQIQQTKIIGALVK